MTTITTYCDDDFTDEICEDCSDFFAQYTLIGGLCSDCDQARPACSISYCDVAVSSARYDLCDHHRFTEGD